MTSLSKRVTLDIPLPVTPEETALTSKASAIETLEAENTELKNVWLLLRRLWGSELYGLWLVCYYQRVQTTPHYDRRASKS